MHIYENERIIKEFVFHGDVMNIPFSGGKLKGGFTTNTDTCFVYKELSLVVPTAPKLKDQLKSFEGKEVNNSIIINTLLPKQFQNVISKAEETSPIPVNLNNILSVTDPNSTSMVGQFPNPYLACDNVISTFPTNITKTNNFHPIYYDLLFNIINEITMPAALDTNPNTNSWLLSGTSAQISLDNLKMYDTRLTGNTFSKTGFLDKYPKLKAYFDQLIATKKTDKSLKLDFTKITDSDTQQQIRNVMKIIAEQIGQKKTELKDLMEYAKQLTDFISQDDFKKIQGNLTPQFKRHLNAIRLFEKKVRSGVSLNLCLQRLIHEYIEHLNKNPTQYGGAYIGLSNKNLNNLNRRLKQSQNIIINTPTTNIPTTNTSNTSTAPNTSPAPNTPPTPTTGGRHRRRN